MWGKRVEIWLICQYWWLGVRGLWQAGLRYYLFQVSVDRTGGWARREAFGARSDLGDFVEEKGEEREEQGTQSHGWPE